MHLLNPYSLSRVVETAWGAYSVLGCLVLGRHRRNGSWLLFGMAWVAFASVFVYIRVAGNAL
ncbi:hypothetical protein [Peterkaempfera sp. SMS 1(5)a]|uniref:hypothetical protein n=1 Tax=Peterkaempfera podocarpi TaxID=3232308 RepID=UPI003671C04D